MGGCLFITYIFLKLLSCLHNAKNLSRPRCTILSTKRWMSTIDTGERCNGTCQNSKPYYGYVGDATNRAPSAHDYWWARHQKTCGEHLHPKSRNQRTTLKGAKGKTKLKAARIRSRDKVSLPIVSPAFPLPMARSQKDIELALR